MYQHESLFIYSNWVEPSMSIDVVHGISVQNGYKRMEKFFNLTLCTSYAKVRDVIALVNKRHTIFEKKNSFSF